MQKIKIFLRMFYIAYVLQRYRLDSLVLSIPLFYPIRFLAYLNPFNWFRKSKLTRGERLRLSLEELGPIFVKFGQMLSTRSDLLPDDIIEELEKLLDCVPPFSSKVAKKIIESSLHKPIKQIFHAFENEPLASASIAQVHAATLVDGKEVVVKVIRPNIKPIIIRDIAILRIIAKAIECCWSEGKRLRLTQVVNEFEEITCDELDFMREAANATQLRRNFDQSQLLYIPEVHWPYTQEKVITFERVYGIPINNINQLRENKVDLKKLAERGVEIFFTQVFRDRFFHADMHAGNIFVANEQPENPQYIAVDFGIVGTLAPNDQRYLAENILAFFNRDYYRVAALHVQSGWVDPDTRVDRFEAAIRTVCEPIFEKPLKDISIGQLLLHLFQTARRFNMTVQPQLVLLQKTLLQVEGLGRDLYPDLDLWQTAKPHLEKWIKSQVGLRALVRKSRQEAPFWAEKLPDVPDMLYQSLEKFDKLTLSMTEQPQKRKKRPGRFLAGLSSAFVLSGLFIFATGSTQISTDRLSISLFSVGVLGLIITLWRNKSWD